MDKKVGYFAYCGDEVLCVGDDACIIAGTISSLNRYISAHYSPGAMVQKRKTWFSEILAGLDAGGYYAFDPKAFKHFKAAAHSLRGIEEVIDVSKSEKDGFPFIIVKPL